MTRFINTIKNDPFGFALFVLPACSGLLYVAYSLAALAY